jgi:hypothetical protein
MIEDKPTLNLDGESYVVEDLSDTAKHYISQVQNLVAQAQDLQNKLQQIEVARVGFAEMLKKEIKGGKKDE